jgi:hypothetical protein
MAKKVILDVGRLSYFSNTDSKWERDGEVAAYEMLNSLCRLNLFKIGRLDRYELKRFAKRMFDRMEIRYGRVEVI